MSTMSSSIRRFLSAGSRGGKKRAQGNQQTVENNGAAQSPPTTAIAVAELPGDQHHVELLASVPAVEPSSREGALELVDRWDRQRTLLHDAFAKVRSLQNQSLETSDIGTLNTTISQLDRSTSNAISLIHNYLDDKRSAGDLPGNNKRICQARLLMREYSVMETEYIIQLQSSMEDAHRRIRPDTSEETISAASTLPSLNLFNMSHHSPEVRDAMRILQTRHQSLLDAKKRLTVLSHMWTNFVAESGLGQSPSSGPPVGSSSTTVIAANGDAVIEYGVPVIYRFRVSSQVLSQVSTFWDYSFKPYRPDSIDARSPPLVSLEHELQETELVRTSFTSPMILRLKSDKHITFEALSLLLYAAHMRTDKVPRNISFQEFVDVASVCHKYRCVAPVELYVERVWLEQWIDCLGKKGYEDFLFISYVFGLERIFEKTSKWAIMRLLSGNYAMQEEVSRLPWEAWLHLRAVQTSTLKKILHHCRETLNTYLLREENSDRTSRPTSYTEADPLANVEALRLRRPTRCIHGSHQCDAANLGWVMLVLNEIGVLPAILDKSQEEGFLQWQTNSLKSILCKLCAAPSALGIHGDACDYAPTFRNEMCRIYNGIKGLSVWDVNDRIRGRRGSAISQAGDLFSDEDGPSRRDHTSMPTEPVSTGNTASLDLRNITNRTNRLSQQSNLNSDGNTSIQTSSDGNTDLTDLTDESQPARLSRQNLEMFQTDIRSVVSTEVELRTEGYPSPTLTTHTSFPTTQNQPLGLYESEDDEGQEDGVQRPLDQDLTPHSQESSQEGVKLILNPKVANEVITQDDKARILAEGVHLVVQGESSWADRNHNHGRVNGETVMRSSSLPLIPRRPSIWGLRAQANEAGRMTFERHHTPF